MGVGGLLRSPVDCSIRHDRKQEENIPREYTPQYITMRHASDSNTQTYKPLRARALTALSYVAGELTKLAEDIDATEAGRKAFVTEQKASGVLEEVRCFSGVRVGRS